MGEGQQGYAGPPPRHGEPWTEAEEAQLRGELAAGRSVADVARGLGRGAGSVATRARRMGGLRALRAPGLTSRRGQLWTPEEADQLRNLIACGWSVRRCSGVLGRPIGGVYHWLLRHGGIDAMRHTTFATRSGREVAAMLGVSYRLVRRWIDWGWLRAHRNYARQSRRAKRLRFLVPDEALEDLLASPRSWLYWSPEQIADRDWREVADQMRLRHGGGQFWTTLALARARGVHQRTVQLWVEEHKASAWYAHERWYVWADGRGRLLPLPEAVRADLEAVRREWWERRVRANREARDAAGATGGYVQPHERNLGDAQLVGELGPERLDPGAARQLLPLERGGADLAAGDGRADHGAAGPEGSPAGLAAA